MSLPNTTFLVHRKPADLSDAVALGFVKALRFCAGAFFTRRCGDRDVVEVVSLDEAHHRDVNHGFADELRGRPAAPVAAAWPHQPLQPTRARTA